MAARDACFTGEACAADGTPDACDAHAARNFNGTRVTLAALAAGAIYDALAALAAPAVPSPLKG